MIFLDRKKRGKKFREKNERGLPVAGNLNNKRTLLAPRAWTH